MVEIWYLILSQRFHIVINNQLTHSSETRRGINPANTPPNPLVPVSSQDDLHMAIQAAKAAFKNWAKTSFEKRRTTLCAWADAIEANTDGFATTLTME